MGISKDLIKDIKRHIDELESYSDQLEKNYELKEMLLEAEVKLNDCVAEMKMKNALEIVDACYNYNRETRQPEYIITMSEHMEKQLLERIKNNPDFKANNDLIEEDEEYPESFRNHVAGILSTLIFNFIMGEEKSKDYLSIINDCASTIYPFVSDYGDIFRLSHVETPSDKGYCLDPDAEPFLIKK